MSFANSPLLDLDTMVRYHTLRCIYREDVKQHSFDVAMLSWEIASVLARSGHDLDPHRLALMGMVHDAPESIYGDMVHDTKYRTDEMLTAARQIDDLAVGELVRSIGPGWVGEELAEMLRELENNPLAHAVVKTADDLSVLLYSLKETTLGNAAFARLLAGAWRRLGELAVSPTSPLAPIAARYAKELEPRVTAMLTRFRMHDDAANTLELSDILPPRPHPGLHPPTAPSAPAA